MRSGETLLLVTIFLAILIFIIARAVTRHGHSKYEAYLQSVTDVLNRNNFHAEKDLDMFVNSAYCRCGHLWFDYQHMRGAYLKYTSFMTYKWHDRGIAPANQMIFFPLNKITECALVQDGTMVHHNAVLSGMVGAAAFGLAGALAGATAMNKSEQIGYLSVRVFIDDISMSSLTFDLLRTSFKKSDQIYLDAFAMAQKVYSEFEGIVRINQRSLSAAVSKPEPAPAGATSAATVKQAPSATGDAAIEVNEKILTQIRNLAQMNKEGILTDEEFAQKKKIYMDKMV
jgi:hypothetical protein